MENNELMHHGIPGMKWGVRRYQNRDGTLTAAGKKRYEKELARLREEERVVKNKEQTKAKLAKLDQKKAALDERKKALEDDDKKSDKRPDAAKVHKEPKTADPRQKSLSELDDKELEAVVRRMNLEERYKQLNPPEVSKGRKFMNSVRDDVVLPAAKKVGKSVMEKLFEKAIDKTGILADDDTKGAAVKKTSETVSDQAKKAADTVSRNYNKAKSKYQSPTVESKPTWVYDDDWWNTPGPRDSSQKALPAPEKKKKRR